MNKEELKALNMVKLAKDNWVKEAKQEVLEKVKIWCCPKCLERFEDLEG